MQLTVFIIFRNTLFISRSFIYFKIRYYNTIRVFAYRVPRSSVLLLIVGIHIGSIYFAAEIK